MSPSPAAQSAGALAQTTRLAPDHAAASRATRVLIVCSIIALVAATRLWRLTGVCLDGDEIFSLLISREGWSSLTMHAARDSVHPPLFYYLLKVWVMIGGDSLLWLRLLPAFLSALCVVPLFLLCRELRFRRSEIIFTLVLFGLSPFLIVYSQHVRMYSLLLLFSAISLWLFYRIVKPESACRRVDYVWLTLANIGLVYSHYYGWLVVALECCYVLLWRQSKGKRFLLSALATLAGFSPWLYLAAKCAYAKGGLASNLSWIPLPGMTAFFWFFVDLAGCAELSARGARTAVLVLCTLLAWALWSRHRLLRSSVFDQKIRFLLFFMIGPPVASFVASHLLPHSVWGHRHLLFVAVPFFLLCAIAFCNPTSLAMRLAMLVACAAWLCVAIASYAKPYDNKLAWDSLVFRVLEQERGADTAVPFYSIDPYLHYPVWFYLETLKAGRSSGFAERVPASERAELGQSATRIIVHKADTVAEFSGNHFWIAYSPSSWKPDQALQALLSERKCRTGQELFFKDRFQSITAFPVWCESAGAGGRPTATDSPGG